MKKTIALALLVSFVFSPLCFAGGKAEVMKVTTGYGYFIKDGKITDKYHLPIGEHPYPVGYGWQECENKAEWDAVQVYVAPEAPEVIAEREIETLIAMKKRDLAVSALKAEGKLDEKGEITTEGKAAVSSEKAKENSKII